MRFISILDAKPGMILAEDISDIFGRMLIVGESVLTTAYIDKLKDLGINGIYIEDEFSKGLKLEPPISPALKNQGMTAVQNQDIDQCKQIAQAIVEEILAKGFVNLDMTDLRTFDNYTFAHSVNVAVLSCTIAFGMGMSDKDMESLVLAGLLHDLGKLSIPEEILNKPGRLTPEEFALIKTHPTSSWEFIKDRIDISSMVKNAVLSHHENFDGSGYPNELSGDNITLMAKIIHVTDVYDALTSRRPYKEPYSAYAALEILEGGKGTLYAPGIVDALIAFVPLYPKGSVVILSDGRKGIVIENKGDHNRKPIIRLENDFSEIDLCDYPDLTITSPGDLDLYKIAESEKNRSDMMKPYQKANIMVLDPKGDTFLNLTQKLGYLHDFTRVSSDSQAEGYIRRDGYPDIIMVDIDQRDLSDEDGLRALNRKVAANTNVLVVGSYGDIETIRKFRSLGINNYILKPFHIIYIQSEIKRVLEYGKERSPHDGQQSSCNIH